MSTRVDELLSQLIEAASEERESLVEFAEWREDQVGCRDLIHGQLGGIVDDLERWQRSLTETRRVNAEMTEKFYARAEATGLVKPE